MAVISAIEVGTSTGNHGVSCGDRVPHRIDVLHDVVSGVFAAETLGDPLGYEAAQSYLPSVRPATTVSP